ncbi:unnamed protein product [Didymodactylos carnosus]|uniref:SURF1-like protein n=1 Tax=Didymodactylos carnosus TaxID=1234261 RepID=A0A8S2H0Y1_9BILA|nr:unnamed protein product [Didymodactylos carnosus]CAF3578297.1 unnamed protein product [Didymodactylos carnosus]
MKVSNFIWATRYLFEHLCFINSFSILVNRGYVSNDYRNPNTRLSGQIEDEHELIGLLRKTDSANMWLRNEPTKGSWRKRDVEVMSEHLNTEPIFLDAIKNPSLTNVAPIGGQTNVQLRNEHLQYIITCVSLDSTSIFSEKPANRTLFDVASMTTFLVRDSKFFMPSDRASLETDKPIIKNRSHTDCEILCHTSHTTTIDIQKSTQNYLSSTTQIPLTITTTTSHSSSLATLLTINKDQLSCRLLSISDDHIYTSICRCLFLLARLGDGLLLIKVTFFIKNYLPCWCQLNWCKQNNDRLNELNDEDCPPSDLIDKKTSNYRHRRRRSPRRYKIKIRFESLYIPHEQKLIWTIENDQQEKCPTGFQ